MANLASTTSAPSTAPIAGSAVGQSKIEFRGVNKSFGFEPPEPVIENLSLTLEPGELTVLVGPSGCGKSTIVNLVAGYEKPDSGSVLLNGKPVSGARHDRMVVFQETALFPWLTSYENIVFGPKLRGDLTGAALEAEAVRLLQIVGLSEFRNKYPSQLSGGMQRRAELARAMINNPQLMIMDEPFRGLDAMSRELMQEFFLRLFERDRRTNLFVTSEIEEAIFLADKLVILSAKPATVRTEIRIDLPRPRDFHMLSSPLAYEYKKQALEILHDEAMKSFGPRGGGSGTSDFVEAFNARMGGSKE